ncbi:uncharacterized protein BDW70DRAFT_134530 [Aspergillus foveolatus]|uniref:uncharacterized protein n=1 Tax=Aspergillus foveolatus TaxID=210207 RepID=UPI003CCE2E00
MQLSANTGSTRIIIITICLAMVTLCNTFRLQFPVLCGPKRVVALCSSSIGRRGRVLMQSSWNLPARHTLAHLIYQSCYVYHISFTVSPGMARPYNHLTTTHLGC